ncbi:MCM DNA helicase complex subunit [Chytridiales sp. JEL 0842]|nr:MCM DNA helicase complex subunit [Chytridiales sp. JEL 0842]
MRSHPQALPGDAEELAEMDEDIIPQDLLKKYIVYARDRIHPKINDVDREKIATLYSDLRRESMIGGSIPITVRYMESMIRMSEAFAKMQLREFVRQDDIEKAIAVMIKSFVGAQKHAVRAKMEKHFSRYLAIDRDSYELLNHILSEVVADQVKVHYYTTGAMPTEVEVDLQDFEVKAREHGVHDVRSYLDSRLFKKSFTFDPVSRIISKVLGAEA